MEIQSDIQQQKYNTNQVITLKDVGIYKVQNLVFFKKKTAMLNSFISSSDGCLIIICKWNPIFKLKQKPEHNWIIRNYEIKFLQLNSEENQIIFALNSQIHFLSSSKSWFCEQKIQNSLNEIRGLSINPNGNQLNITIRELHNSEWKLKQTLPIIGQNFVLQTISCSVSNQLNLKHYQSTHSIATLENIQNLVKQFVKDQLNKIKQSNLIIVPMFNLKIYYQALMEILQTFYNFLSLKNLQNYECRVVQSIEFKDISIIGTISDNGEFLIIYDPTLNEIQVRENQDQK
ncbi:unnamed protein product [Paramecium pentaurelia]|uniref:Uncharacterized protein n=1 Tax=Paramecium pentaurelia TaxID=43138 RepID=A0A8S1VT33_9CILI|nr:unnamed protein product [Paramecium pentaurelia]